MTHLETAFKAVSTANDALNLKASCLGQLQTLFNAIVQAAPDHPTVTNLAHIGIYLAEDYGALCEGEARSSEAEFMKLRAIMFK